MLGSSPLIFICCDKVVLEYLVWKAATRNETTTTAFFCRSLLRSFADRAVEITEAQREDKRQQVAAPSLHHCQAQALVLFIQTLSCGPVMRAHEVLASHVAGLFFASSALLPWFDWRCICSS